MTAFTIDRQRHVYSDSDTTALTPIWVDQLLNDVFQPLPPLWPLADFVAVNPWTNVSEQTLLEVHQSQQLICDSDLLPAWSILQQMWKRHGFTESHVFLAFEQLSQDPSFRVAWQRVLDLLSSLQTTCPTPPSNVRQYWTVSEYMDRDGSSSWSSHILNDVTRNCAAQLDEGQALWQNPWQSLSLFDAWRESAQRSRRMEWLGLTGFRRLVASLPMSPRLAIVQILGELAIPREQWAPFLKCQLATVYGWATYLKYQAEFATPPSPYDDLSGLLAIRLAYDLCLQRQFEVSTKKLFPSERARSNSKWLEESDEVNYDAKLRYLLMRASEIAYQQHLQMTLQPREKQSNRPHFPDDLLEAKPQHKRVQMVFCIDVRSEVLRRHLEAVDPCIETYGFAGFFAMPIEHVSIGEEGGVPQCPVLLKPLAVAHDHSKSTSVATATLSQRTREENWFRRCWSHFQKSALSAFAFVEGLGWTYAFQLFQRTSKSLFGKRISALGKHRHDIVVPSLLSSNSNNPNFSMQVDLAANLLKNLGLTQDFAPLVVICGHACDVTNNPYRAGLDCGACGGHSGAPNARVAAALLNRMEVRDKLAQRGIRIPNSTWFIPAVHHTTTDVVELLDLDNLPLTQEEHCQELQYWIEEASHRVREERVQRMGDCPANDVFRRSVDWSEVRPEWGLAGNSAFIVAPRSLTRGHNLEGQTFLHSYDHERDADGAVLELIMTAPMIVASWINLQYYASTVNNQRFGSGNKLLHNVTGQFGILEGNGGDLRFGLPWQSVFDGKSLQHTPRRLAVLIQAPRKRVQAIMDKHFAVRQLIQNQWVNLIVIDQGTWYQWTRDQGWTEFMSNSSC
ncbi:MAG: DUF2309 domain-containing protein [Planctomycetaceae bacterium]|nr:DUF2309 domain-containing protein [Planctomycetaceae bacterium]